MIAKSIRLYWALLLYLAMAWAVSGCMANVDDSAGATAAAAQPGEYLFCHWNVENFFDDKADKRSQKADHEFDAWFATNPQVMQLKLAKLTEALLRMNEGRGPDILAICEVESIHAAEMLMQALNKKLAAGLQYQHVLMKEVSAGRHIAPAIITRLPVRAEKTRLHGKMLRILEGHVVVEGHELTIFATHWTSRIQSGSDKQRAKYADTIYQAVAEIYQRDARADVLICGDFNDTPHDESVVKHLHSSANVNEVLASPRDPLLYNLFSAKDAKGFGTHFYSGKWFIFDQVLVSPGMLNEVGWSCDPASAQTFNSLYRPGDAQKRPWRFGDEKDKAPRGYSDHFPVTVKLRVK